MRIGWFRLWRHGLIIWRLSWRERGLLLRAWWMLHGIALALRWVSFQRVYGFLGRRVGTTPPAVGDEMQLADQARALTRLVQGAAVWSLHRPTCLHRSLTLWWLLGRQGIVSELRIGVRMEQGRFEAHAWVEYKGVALNDGLDVGLHFAAFQGL
ncbi:MAG: lasso peptide biosynthesis B2 protein [Candidatus Competibacteraceae bacterium]|nr:MAG: lasso peptide biosynthesis B2 protein [Candidatus Competibacteraceae bacterium]